MFGDPFTQFDDMAPREGWDVAQVCVRGHLITSSYRTSPQFAEKFCSKCGAATITSCPVCNQPIRGHYHMPGVIFPPDNRVENFCYHCGKPYPWHAEKLEAAKEFAVEVELPDDERKLLVKSYEDIASDNASAPTGVVRIKRYMKKVGKGAADAMYKFAVEVSSEAIKKTLTEP